ncbi:RNA-guided endonuclease InsQ/TnpB family protein [Nocardia sp. IBHARD005]|uniref:RNA-guided endonuclease InsQ/TnpB family protein n=1 Tax=Nocardia sp. IBHARD005 TaxID=3457765 RepID=UPI0040594319
MQLRYNFRVYPTPGQSTALARAFGCARVVFNDGLAARRAARAAGLPYIKDSALQTQVITTAKTTPERAWLSEVSSVVLVQALADLHSAYRNFFASVTGTRKGPKLARPKFRSRKDNRQSIRFTRNGFSLRPNGRLYVAKIGELMVAWSRELPSVPSSVTITKDSAGRYFASFVIVVTDELLPQTGTEVGIDLGLATFAVLSDGKTIASPRFLRQAERRLRKAQQSLSRKDKGSKNRDKARTRVARAHARVADTRRDWAHKHSTTIIRDNQAVFIENLSIKGLARTRLAKSVHDAGWGMFTCMLEQKAAQYGRYFAKVDRWFPSTRMCSVCGVVSDKKPLHVREWICKCGTIHDRDLNAARNILAAGQAERLNACGGAVSLPV